MLNALRAKRKSGFLNGSMAKPAEESLDLESWLSVNSMILEWIRTSNKPRVHSTMMFITEACKLWENLKNRLSVGNKVRVHQLVTKLATSRQGGQAVIDYYGHL